MISSSEIILNCFGGSSFSNGVIFSKVIDLWSISSFSTEIILGANPFVDNTTEDSKILFQCSSDNP